MTCCNNSSFQHGWMTLLVIVSWMIIGLEGGGSSSNNMNYKMNAPFGLSIKGGSSSSSSSRSSSVDGSSSAPGGPSANGSTSNGKQPIRVAFQGEPGAYSEKALRELLGENVIAVPRSNFEACYKAVANRECEYACLPFENSLGGSIHENYDLMMRYDLTVVAEHECRVSHCLLAKHGVTHSDIKYCLSHPQALAQCDNFLRARGITPVPMYDTAGSAKLIMEGHTDRDLPDNCTPANTAAIASDLAGKTYKLNCLEKAIEDDDSNFTRFLLLGRTGVSQHLNKQMKTKTSIVFTLPNTPGALYKALACFSLRDIDFSKIESRPTSANLLNFLKFKSKLQYSQSDNSSNKKEQQKKGLPRFRYCFYLDFLASEWDDSAQHALQHLREQADFVRVLGSYPQKSRLVGTLQEQCNRRFISDDQNPSHQFTLPSDKEQTSPFKIGIIGYGAYGQYLGSRFAKASSNHQISCLDSLDMSKQAEQNGVTYYPSYEMSAFLKDLDVVVLAVPLVDFEETVASLPHNKLRGKLVVEVCPLCEHPKSILQQYFGGYKDIDILCTHPMFGPIGSTDNSIFSDDVNDIHHHNNDNQWDGQPMIYDKVYITDELRAARYLDIFSEARCQMVEMTSEQHDACTADAEFVTHLIGWLLVNSGSNAQTLLPPTPVASKEYASLCDVTDITSSDTFDLFYGMYKFNTRAKDYIDQLRQSLANLDRKLAAKEAYIAASRDMKNNDRQRLITEFKNLLQDTVIGNSDDTNIMAKTRTNDELLQSQQTITNKAEVTRINKSTKKGLGKSSSKDE